MHMGLNGACYQISRHIHRPQLQVFRSTTKQCKQQAGRTASQLAVAPAGRPVSN